jgi:hypothetical protein
MDIIAGAFGYDGHMINASATPEHHQITGTHLAIGYGE